MGNEPTTQTELQCHGPVKYQIAILLRVAARKFSAEVNNWSRDINQG